MHEGPQSNLTRPLPLAKSAQPSVQQVHAAMVEPLLAQYWVIGRVRFRSLVPQPSHKMQTLQQPQSKQITQQPQTLQQPQEAQLLQHQHLTQFRLIMPEQQIQHHWYSVPILLDRLSQHHLLYQHLMLNRLTMPKLPFQHHMPFRLTMLKTQTLLPSPRFFRVMYPLLKF